MQQRTRLNTQSLLLIRAQRGRIKGQAPAPARPDFFAASFPCLCVPFSKSSMHVFFSLSVAVSGHFVPLLLHISEKISCQHFLFNSYSQKDAVRIKISFQVVPAEMFSPSKLHIQIVLYKNGSHGLSVCADLKLL